MVATGDAREQHRSTDTTEWGWHVAIEWSERSGVTQQEGEEAQRYSTRLPLVGQVEVERDRARNGWVLHMSGRSFGVYETSDAAKAKATEKLKAAVSELLTAIG